MPPPTYTFQIHLIAAPTGVDFALQSGRAANSTIVQKQRGTGADLFFTFTATCKPHAKTGEASFGGPFVQGPPNEQFVYINIGTSAGQFDSCWTRRMKIPLRPVAWELLEQASASERPLETQVPGTGRDGTPTCATVKPFEGWALAAKATSPSPKPRQKPPA